MHLTVRHIEANQSIQSESNSIPLIAGKMMAVRFYFDAPESAQIRGTLLCFDAEGGTHNFDSLGAAIILPGATISSLRLSLTGGLTFLVPGDSLKDGITRFRLSSLVREDQPDSITFEGQEEFAFSIAPSPSMTLELIGFSYKSGNPPRNLEPSEFDLKMILSWIQRAFPISKIHARFRMASSFFPELANPLISASSDRQKILGYIKDIRLMDTENDSRTFYLGLVHYDPAGILRGDSSIDVDENGFAIIGDLDAVAFSMVGPNTFNWDHDGSSADWYAGHELAHLCGRRHSARCRNSTSDDDNYPHVAGRIGGGLDGEDGSEVGFDVGDAGMNLSPRVVSWQEAHDVTTYCNNIWISGYTYREILTFLNKLNQLDDDDASAGPSFLKSFAQDSEVGIFVRGSVNRKTCRGSIDEVLPHSDGIVSKPDPDSDVKIMLIGIDNSINEMRMKLRAPICRYDDEPLVEGFSVRLQTSVETVEIQLFIGDQLVDTFPLIEQSSESAVLKGSELLSGKSRRAREKVLSKFIVRTREDNGKARTLTIMSRRPQLNEIQLERITGYQSMKIEVTEIKGLHVLETWELME